MPLFDDNLSFSTPAGPSLLPGRDTHLVISDALTASADVALWHLVMAAVAQGVPVVWVDFRSASLPSLDAILRRLGTPLPPAPRFTFISPSPLPPGVAPPDAPGLFTPEPDVSPTIGAVKEALAHALEGRPHLNDDSASALVILDGLSALSDMGFTPSAVQRMVRALLADGDTAGAALVSTLHLDDGGVSPASSASSPSATIQHDLAARVLRTANAYWRITGISPRSADVSGQITATDLGNGAVGASAPVIPAHAALQFRLEPAAVKVFPKGTGRGYL